MTASSVHGHLWCLTLCWPMVNLPPSSHDGAISTCWIQLPDFFSFDLSLILLKPSQACPTATSTSNSHTAKSALMPNCLFEMGPGQVNHTRTTVKDQQRLRIYRTRNSKAIGIIISHNLCSNVGYNKITFDKKEKIDGILTLSLIFSTLCFGFVTVSWQNVGNNNHPAAILTCD